jgi:hypothetical protein
VVLSLATKRYETHRDLGRPREQNKQSIVSKTLNDSDEWARMLEAVPARCLCRIIASFMLVAALGLSGTATSQESRYFEQTASMRVPGPGVDIMISPKAPFSALTRMISIWCQFPLDSGSNPTGVLAQVIRQGAGRGDVTVTIPMVLQLADDRAASPSRYFAGTIQTFYEAPAGAMSHISIISDASSSGARGVCYASFFGDLTKDSE